MKIDLQDVIDVKETWFQFFDMIRIIEPGGTHKVLYYNGREAFDMEKPCFHFWDRCEHCSNCVSKRAFFDQTTVMKFEYRKSSYYLVLAKPVQYQGASYILELVLNVTKQMLDDKEELKMKDLVVDIVDRLEHASSKEAFTKLYNKSYMMELYNRLRDSDSKKLYMALIDIDHFKLVNDIYGHDLGDQAILTIANELQASFEKIGTIARFGGDEFGIIFDGDDEELYRQSLKETMEKLDQLVYESDGRKFHITSSYGLAEIKGTESFSDAVHAVDKELYYAKRKNILDMNRVDEA